MNYFASNKDTFLLIDTMLINCTWLQWEHKIIVHKIHSYTLPTFSPTDLDRWKCVQCIRMHFACINVGWRQLYITCQCRVSGWKSFLRALDFHSPVLFKIIFKACFPFKFILFINLLLDNIIKVCSPELFKF